METAVKPSAVIAGRYVLERELGRGGMATVYLARDRRHDALVALKVLHPELAPHFAGERFAREIRITAGLQHPSIVPILDSGETDGLPYYTMPFVDGESLATRLHRERQLPVADTLSIATAIADALAYAHERGFVHRDIKPQNILLSRGHAVLADFGIARAMDASGGERITESGVALGTAMYMSPEQGSGATIDGRSDIYALGCVLYEMLAGIPPFTGPTVQTVLARHAVDPVPPIRTVRQTVGPALEQLLDKCLAKVPADRFSSAHELKAALAAAATEQATLPVTGRARALPPRWGGRTAILGVVGVAVLATLATFAWRAGPASARELDPNRVAVFPVRVPDSFTGPRSVGEDIATMIGHALDGTGPLRWVDGWRLLDSRPPADRAPATDDILRALARDRGCRFYVTGRLVAPPGDSVSIYLDLIDTAGDSVVTTGSAVGLATDAWRVGVRAVNQVLPKLIPGGAEREVLAGWIDRNPEVVAKFLLGEAAFRRARAAEALTHYRAAIRDDSTFALAAVRGAQAATWEHRDSEAATFIRLAVAQQLAPRYEHFARGYAAYLEGRADSATAEFRRALAIDGEMAAAWMQLGETYTHLLPVTGAPTPVADSAFAEAMRIDSSATHILLHPIESLLRRGRAADAAPLVRRFLAADPDATLADEIRTIDACISRGAAAVNWANAVKARPYAVLYAAQSLAVGGSQLPCAAAAYTALRTYETPEMAAADAIVDTRRWTALVGLQGVLIAQGRTGDAIALIDSAITRGEGGHSLMLVNGPLVPAFESHAARSKERYEQQWGPNCQRCTSNDRLWQLGVWATHRGDTASLDVLAAELDARAKATDAPGVTLMARATAARTRLAKGDTSAIAALDDLLRTPIPSGGALLWRDAEGRGPERLALARALMARRQFRRAIDVADGFDAPANQTYVAYVPASLELRASAADSLGASALHAAYRARLTALGRDVAAAPRE